MYNSLIIVDDLETEARRIQIFNKKKWAIASVSSCLARLSKIQQNIRKYTLERACLKILKYIY